MPRCGVPRPAGRNERGKAPLFRRLTPFGDEDSAPSLPFPKFVNQPDKHRSFARDKVNRPQINQCLAKGFAVNFPHWHDLRARLAVFGQNHRLAGMNRRSHHVGGVSAQFS